MNPDINAPRIQSWNVSVERQIGAVWGTSVSYLGSYSDRLWGLVARNPGVYLGLDPCTINGVRYTVCTTNTNLNQRRALSLSAENPASAQLIGNLDSHAAVGTQAWSRCVGLEMPPNAQFGIGYTDPSNPDYDRGHCDADRTHLANGTVGFLTPHIGNPVLNLLASSWRVSGIVNARSGSWFTVLSGRDGAFNGQANQRVDQLLADVYGAKTLTSYLNRAAFGQPASGTFGTHQRNSIKGPGFWKVDLALSRLVSLASTQNLEFRVEVFNLFNNFNWGNPNTNFTAGTFGRVTTAAGDQRIMQFRIKYGF